MLLTLFFLILPGLALAVPPTRLTTDQASVTIENGQILVRLSLSVDHEDGLRDMLKDGAVLELGIAMSLERKRSWWANAEMATQNHASVIMHDPLSRDFIVLVPSLEGHKELRDRNLTRLIYSSWRALVLPLASLESLADEDPDDQFTIAISISLRHTNVPPWLEKSIIWSADAVPSENLVLPFRLPAPSKAAP